MRGGPGGGGSDRQVDWAARDEALTREGEVTAPLVGAAVGWLAERVPRARDVLDAGSGPGVAACLFASALPTARVLAVDAAAPLLELARARAVALGVGDRVTMRVMSLPDGLADVDPVDLVWISGVMHHLPDPVVALRALGGRLRPGGLLAVREGGLPLRFLPDGAAPGLLPRLEALADEVVAAGEHPAGIADPAAGWPELLEAAGLRPAGSRSFLLDLPAPASAPAREYLRRRLAGLRHVLGDRPSAADRAALDRLLDPGADDGVLRRPDVFLLTAGTVHTAGPD